MKGVGSRNIEKFGPTSTTNKTYGLDTTPFTRDLLHFPCARHYQVPPKDGPLHRFNAQQLIVLALTRSFCSPHTYKVLFLSLSLSLLPDLAGPFGCPHPSLIGTGSTAATISGNKFSLCFSPYYVSNAPKVPPEKHRATSCWSRHVLGNQLSVLFVQRIVAAGC
jgi:hypothetical protein